MLENTIVAIIFPWLVAFLLGLLITPPILRLLTHFRCWKKQSGNNSGMGGEGGTPIFNRLHRDRDVRVPRMGGLVIVGAVLCTTIAFWLISFFTSGGPSGGFDFLSRAQTWLPLAAFIAGAAIGFIDDVLTIGLTRFVPGSRGLALRYRLFWAIGCSCFAAYWFYNKLGYQSVWVPGYGDFFVGWWFIPFFIVIFVALFATSNIDGLDGLSGGIMSIIFSAYGFVAYSQGQTDIAAFCFVIVGGTLAFLWFNVPPARFYMTEVGYNALSFSLAIIAFITDTVLLLPLIALCLFATELTTIMQVVSKKIRKKKIFQAAPIHHHFEALGWPAHQVVMRYWIVSIVAAVLGVMVALGR